MTVPKVRLSQRTKQEFGQAGINEMCRHLYAVDCQTCGGSLGIQAPAVTVDDYGTHVQAQLHHEGCRQPRWIERRVIVDDLSLPSALTYQALPLMLRYEVFPGLVPDLPVLLLNSGLEAVTLERGTEGWRVSTVERYVGYGLHAAASGKSVPTVAGGLAVLRDAGRGLEPVLNACLDPLHEWDVPVQHYLANAIIRQRGLVLLVTSAVNPGVVTAADVERPRLLALLDSGQCAFGWLPLRDGAP